MPRRATLINALTRGELDPALRERIDLAHYYLALAKAREVRVLPQGGFTHRGGSLMKTRLRRRVEPVPLTTASLTVHNGGTIANLVDEDPATVFATSAVANATHVIVEVDFGSAQTIAFVDVRSFLCATSRADNALVVEWWDGGAWQPFGGANDFSLSPRRNIRLTARTRRFAGAPGYVKSSRFWRVVLYDAVGTGAITVGGLRFWREKRALSPVRVFDFAKSEAEDYEAALTDRNVDFFDAGQYVGSVAVAINGAEIAAVNAEQSQDTLFLYHENVETVRVTRQGAADEWNVEPLAVVNVPALTPSTAFTGDADEVQRLAFPAISAGQSVIVLFGSQIAAPFTYATPGDLPGQLVTALKALPGIAADNVLASLTSLTPVTVEVRFVNSNGSKRWPPVFATVLGSDLAPPETTIVQRGLNSAGKLMGADTGWPRAGAVNQGRHIVGGFRAAPQTYAASVVNTVTDFLNTGSPLTAEKGFVDTLDTDQVEVIQDIFVGASIQIFTNSGEWWVEARALDATQPRNVRLATRHGVAAAVPIVFADEATVFVQEGDDKAGPRTIRDFEFTDAKANYTAEPLSLIAPHLLTDIVDLAFRPSVSVDEGNLLFVVNRAGDFALMTLMRSQEIIAMARCATDGAMRAAVGDTNKRVWWAVERSTAAGADLYLEQWDRDGTLDSAVAYAGAPISIVTGLGHLEGKTVWALADGDFQGPFVVSGAAITLTKAAASIVAGLGVLVDTETLPLREKLQNAQPFRPPARIYEVELSVLKSAHVKMAISRGPAFDVPLRHFDGGPLPEKASGEEPANDKLDTPLMQRLYTGPVTMDGLLGWSEHPSIRLFQEVPAPLTVRAIRYEVSY